jgi:CheY-like chemotaxis protein
MTDREEVMPKGTVLVVDDDDELRESICESLADEGYEVVGASHGGEALRYLRSAPAPRVILLDLMMPVMNGWQFREEQRKDPALARIPVVVLTADRSARRDAIEVDDLVQKPVSLERLLSVVGGYFG